MSSDKNTTNTNTTNTNTSPIVADLSNQPLQSSNDCFIRFFRFTRRDTRDHIDRRPAFVRREANGGGIYHGRDLKLGNQIGDARIVDVASDIISCSVVKSKSSASGAFEVLLSPADINYHHVLHPGDHAMIWMRRSRTDHVDKNKVISDTFNTKFDSGFKMYGVITDVRRTFNTLIDGRKVLRYKVSGKDIGYFFESQIYYSAVLAGVLDKQGIFINTVLQSNNTKTVASLAGISSGSFVSPDTIIPFLIDIYLGVGAPDKLQQESSKDFHSVILSPNTKMILPNGVGQFFNRSGTSTLADILKRRIGVEKYIANNKPDPKGLVPTGIITINDKTPKMEGWKPLIIEAGNQQSVWEHMRSYANLAINELFVDLKPNLDPHGNYVLYPTVVCRQIPFTSTVAKKAYDNMKQSVTTGGGDDQKIINYTTFLELPRLRIPEGFIISEDIGRGTQERFNFLEMIGQYPALKAYDVCLQELAGNYCMDSASIQRYGLRTLFARTDYQIAKPEDTILPQDKFGVLLSTKWIYLITDWWLGAHTLESGTFNFIGIEEPLSLGDNIEIIRNNGHGVSELYHIEGYQHNYEVMANGIGTFRTSVQVTRGQRIDEYPIYASGQFDEESGLNVGLSDTEPEGTTRPTNSTTSNEMIATSPKESPEDRKKVNS